MFDYYQSHNFKIKKVAMIIKCPECGHQVSDKAPICPSCGVEIAGHLIKCSYCGEIYLKEDAVCPNCHHSAFYRQ